MNRILIVEDEERIASFIAGGAAPQPCHRVPYGVPRGQHDHRGRHPGLAQAAQAGEAVPAWRPDVQQDQV